MNESSITANPDPELRRWRRRAIICGLTTGFSFTLLAATAFLAVQDLGTHYNLYYLLWKAGMRRYEPPIALGGLFHDRNYRQRFVGMSVEQFERAFPNTFYKVRKAPPIAKPNQEFYIDDYQQSQRESGAFGMCWLAVFEEGRLIEFDFSKT